VNAFLNAGTLELCDRGKNTGHESTRRRARVDPLAERDERDAARLPLVEQEDEMAHVPAETIQSPAHDTLHAMTTHVGDELIEGGPAIL